MRVQAMKTIMNAKMNAKWIFAGRNTRLGQALLSTIGFVILTGAVGRADTVGRQFPLYVGDNYGNAVLQVDASGNATLFAAVAKPSAIATAQNGDVYLTTDVFDPCCAFNLYKISNTGVTQFPNIIKPKALAFDYDGNLYAALQDGTVVRVDSSGNPVLYGTGWLASMAFGPDGHLYATRFTREIYRMSDAGTLELFTTLNTSTSFFATGIAFDKTGNMFISGSTNHTIMKIDTAGNQTVFTKDGYLLRPWGIAIDDAGALYIASTGNGAIVKVKPDGTQSLFANNMVVPVWLAFTHDSYTFSGFLGPFNGSGPIITAGKAGRIFPLRWQLTSKAGAYVTSLSAIHTITTKRVACDTLTPTTTVIDLATAPGNSGLRYDSQTNQYLLNWQSPSQPGCYTLTLTLDTKQTFEAYFNLK